MKLGQRPALLAAILLVVGCDASAPHNVVLISVDTLRRDHLGLFGYSRDTTPRIDAFFEGKTIFDNALSPAPCTLPALAQLLHGSYVPRPGRLSLAETLRARGYATAAVVSQHQLRPAWHGRGGAGFELASAVANGFELFDVQGADEVDLHGMSARSARAVSERALSWLSAVDEPFLLWLHYFDPHDPYEPPPRFRGFDRGNGSARSGDRRRDLMTERRPEERWFEAGRIFDEEDVAHLVNLYDGEIRFVDAQVGRVLDALAKHRLLESTVVVFVSDHGEWLGEGQRWDHCQTLRDVEVGVPFLWSVAGERLAGQGRIATPVSTLDLVPTLLGLLGIDHHPDSFDGVDLSDPPAVRSVFSDWRGATAVRRGPWKLVVGEAPLALFDLQKGGEESNVVGGGLREEALLADEVRHFREAHPVSELNGEVLERLQGLGYIE
jgi:arylsulfatase A-like enzyme